MQSRCLIDHVKLHEQLQLLPTEPTSRSCFERLMSPIEAFLGEVPPLFRKPTPHPNTLREKRGVGLLAPRINCSGAELALVLAEKAGGIGRVNRLQFR